MLSEARKVFLTWPGHLSRGPACVQSVSFPGGQSHEVSPLLSRRQIGDRQPGGFQPSPKLSLPQRGTLKPEQLLRPQVRTSVKLWPQVFRLI